MRNPGEGRKSEPLAFPSGPLSSAGSQAQSTGAGIRAGWPSTARAPQAGEGPQKHRRPVFTR